MIKLVFFKAPKPNWIQKLIRWRQLGPFNHVAMLIDGLLWEAIPRGIVANKWVEREGVEIVEVDNVSEPAVKQWWLDHLGQPYDAVGLVEIAAGKPASDNKAWFCSEACTAALQEAGLFKFINPSIVTPHLLWAMAMARREV